ncbi:VacJ family lipoprotein [Moritella sp. JT01]|uniref:MlaA family lipoprotein n=1 Tax=Moritella sp. JT01 TaxID=756698 RepID=UPI000798F17A|nr:VacJ family lipoprotein [Moritella sp. JT01]KXO06451.1 VacJ family lipoprotein [Moritella sp. JT01]
MQNSNNFSRLFTVPLLLLILVMSGCAVPKNNDKESAEIHPTLPQSQPIPTVVSSTPDYIEDDGLFAEDDEDGLFTEEDDLFYDDSPIEIDNSDEISDPFYYFNIAMFHVNDKLYFWVMRPTALGYKAITPQFFRVGVANFFHNIAMPVRFTSSLFQGDIKSTGTELGRFVVNSTIGLLGVMDPAAHYLDWQPNNQDMGLTLGKYGIGNGPYIVWPVFGPSTLRDTVGRGTDYFLSPLSYLKPDKLSLAVQAVDKVNATYFSLGDYETFKQAYIDPYERMKEFYLEYRADKVAEK